MEEKRRGQGRRGKKERRRGEEGRSGEERRGEERRGNGREEERRGERKGEEKRRREEKRRGESRSGREFSHLLISSSSSRQRQTRRPHLSHQCGSDLSDKLLFTSAEQSERSLALRAVREWRQSGAVGR